MKNVQGIYSKVKVNGFTLEWLKRKEEFYTTRRGLQQNMIFCKHDILLSCFVMISEYQTIMGLIPLLPWQRKHKVCVYRMHSQVCESDFDQCLQTLILRCTRSAKNVALRMISLDFSVFLEANSVSPR